MRKYELITILRDSDLEASRKAFKEILDNHKLTPSKEEDWGQRKLFHEIDHNKSGQFVYCAFDFEPIKIKDVAHDLSISTNVLRYMFRVLS